MKTLMFLTIPSRLLPAAVECTAMPSTAAPAVLVDSIRERRSRRGFAQLSTQRVLGFAMNVEAVLPNGAPTPNEYKHVATSAPGRCT
ncbi:MULTISPECIES: hypothetical protein [Actinosynnema]|uniref:hypothetical protein n=1 Tax=Actinosynnema TaxID=40566 RepID=UPI0020A59E71|nr:hypothetical protein [Actinosynnema pretiosum]